jgi:Cof subfamily protein (haloacid dehalogenase superfamily)
MMPEAVRDLPFVRYAITINGAQVYDRQTDAAIVREEIPVGRAVEIMELLDGFDVIYDCYRNNWGWMSARLKEKAEAYATDEHYLKMVREFRNPVEDLKRHLLDTVSEGGVQKVMLFSRNDEPDAKELRAIEKAMAEKFPEIKITSSTWNDLEFNSPSAHKGSSLARFAEHLGLGLENCMSFGDGRNDLTMIEAAGIGVAMENAVEEVKAAADCITLSNDENGVAETIYGYFSGKIDLKK